MPNKTSIEWTDFTSNPIRFRVRGSGERAWHCEKVSPGCAHCYAEGLELGRFGSGRLGAGKPRMIFIGDMTDIFGDWVPDAWLDKLFAVMAMRPDLIFQVLTKRADRMAEYLFNLQALEDRVADIWHSNFFTGAWPWNSTQFVAAGRGRTDREWPLENVWLGVSVEDQARADERIPHLLRCPAAVRWLSCEPLLGPLDLDQPRCEKHDREFARVDEHYGEICTECAADGGTGEMPCGMWLDGCAIENKSGIAWVVSGGESGRFARPPHPDWFRSLRDQCQAAGVPFFFKQWGGASKKSAGRMLDGRTHDAYPEVRA